MTAINQSTLHQETWTSNEFLTDFIAEQTTEGTSGTSGTDGASGSSGTSGVDGGGGGYWILAGFDPGYILTYSTGETSTVDDAIIILSGGTYDFNLHSATGSGQQIVIKSLSSGTIRIIAQGGELIDDTNIKSLTSYSAFTVIDYALGQWILI